MARRHQPPMTAEQIQSEMDNWNSVYDAGLISYAEHQKAVKRLNTLLARRKRDASHQPENKEILEIHEGICAWVKENIPD